MSNTKRDIGIDILKFIAVLFITNSHMELLYGKYSVLATGGAIGDVLFFFASGFTLFMKPLKDVRTFPDWYKRRINRIYPTVFAVAVIECTFWDVHHDINYIILYGGGWFVSCIMIYYVVIYFIGIWMRQQAKWLIVAVSLSAFAWFLMIERDFPFNMYGYHYLKWLVYFNFMLLGAILGGAEIKGHSIRDLCFALIGIAGFYAFYIIPQKVESLEMLEIVSFVPLLFAVYHLYRWGNSPFANRIFQNKRCQFVIRFIGGLCLEIYLIQGCLFTDRWNSLFPLNLVMMFVVIVVAAYMTRCLSRFISQTFKESPYDWKAIINVY